MAASTRRRPLSATEVEARDADRRRKVEAAHERLTAGVAALVEGEAWQAMLSASARFHDYSWRNVLLILAQRPDATRVAGYRTWQRLGRQVCKGEQGIAVLAPVTYRAAVDEDEQANGNPADASERDRLVRVRGWKVEYVFDVSQTGGEPLRDVAPVMLEGEGPAGLWAALADQITAEGFTLVRAQPESPGAFGSMDRTAGEVRVRPDLPEAQASKTLAHERAHIALGHGAETCADPRSRVEVEAESVAFLVSAAAGLDTSSYSFPYIAGWAGPGREADAVAATADRVIATARAILGALQTAAPAAQLIPSG
jgi:hypothetical protein